MFQHLSGGWIMGLFISLAILKVMAFVRALFRGGLKLSFLDVVG